MFSWGSALRWPVIFAASYAGQLTTLVSSRRTRLRWVTPALSTSFSTGMNPTDNESSAPSRSRVTTSRPCCVSLILAVMCSPSSRLSALVMRPMSSPCW